MSTSEKILKTLETFTDDIQSVILSTKNPKGETFASYSPFVEDKDGNYYVYLSTAVPHAYNLYTSKKAHILFLEDESKTEHIYARRRLYFDAVAEKFKPDDKRDDEIFALFKERFKDKVAFFSGMKDFRLYKLTPSNGNLVLGFGQAFKVSADRKTLTLNDKGHYDSHENGLKEYDKKFK